MTAEEVKYNKKLIRYIKIAVQDLTYAKKDITKNNIIQQWRSLLNPVDLKKLTKKPIDLEWAKKYSIICRIVHSYVSNKKIPKYERLLYFCNEYNYDFGDLIDFSHNNLRHTRTDKILAGALKKYFIFIDEETRKNIYEKTTLDALEISPILKPQKYSGNDDLNKLFVGYSINKCKEEYEDVLNIKITDAIGSYLNVKTIKKENSEEPNKIFISRKTIDKDIFTTERINRYIVDSITNKYMNEEITSDIPNINKELIKNLDENGIIKVGASVFSGDILVGKTTLKNEQLSPLQNEQLSPKERLLRAIFGNTWWLNTSFKLPNINYGNSIITDVETYSKKYKDKLRPDVNMSVHIYVKSKFKLGIGDILSDTKGNRGVVSKILEDNDLNNRNGENYDIVTNFPIGNYIVKRYPIAEDIAEARSTGTYNQIDSRPVLGKENHGGQKINFNYISKFYNAGLLDILKEMIRYSKHPNLRIKLYKEVVKGSTIHENKKFNKNRIYVYKPQLTKWSNNEHKNFTLTNNTSNYHIEKRSFKKHTYIVQKDKPLENIEVNKHKVYNNIDSINILLNSLGIKTEINQSEKTLKLQLLSDNEIDYLSHGQIKYPYTIDYRTTKPEMGGLLCERIFGPTEDWKCHCGKYKSIKHKGIICDKCGVEITSSKVRRERMGHIELSIPIIHPLFINEIALFLNIKIEDLIKVVNYLCYIVINPKSTHFKYKEIIYYDDYVNATKKYGADGFDVDVGGNAIKKLLSKINKEDIIKNLNSINKSLKDKEKAEDIEKLKSFVLNGFDPKTFILSKLLVPPAAFRTISHSSYKGRDISFLNSLYRSIINSSNEIRKLIKIGALDGFVLYQKRKLQEAVNLLFSLNNEDPYNHSSEKNIFNPKSLIEFSIETLSKIMNEEVLDYSAKSVCIVDDSLENEECIIPKKVALELFKPYIINSLITSSIASDIQNARKLIEDNDINAYIHLGKIIKDKYIMIIGEDNEGEVILCETRIADQFAISVNLTNYLKLKLNQKGFVNVFFPAHITTKYLLEHSNITRSRVDSLFEVEKQNNFLKDLANASLFNEEGFTSILKDAIIKRSESDLTSIISKYILLT